MSNGSENSGSGDAGSNGSDSEERGRLGAINARLAALTRQVRDLRIVAAFSALGGLAAGAAAVYLAVGAEWPSVSAEEDRCAGYVQDRIAWNDDGNTRWDSSALTRLCRGTERPTQPGLCFDTVFHGALEAGAAIQQDWQDAADLCAGTNDAQTRVKCYRDAIGRGLHFRDAIETCNPPPEVAGQTACERLVQGNIAWNEAGDTTWTPRRLDVLCADTTRPTQPLICFDRLFHGKGSWAGIIGDNWRRAAQLCAGTNSAQQTAECVTSELASLEDTDATATPQILDRDEAPASDRTPVERQFNAVLSACNPRRPTDRSERCKRFVQGNIPWSDRGYRDWQPDALDELCGQTRQPQAPGMCFFRAVSGVIGEERKGLSKWAYAVDLCAGANNADARLSCYERQREAGETSRAAIKACKEAAED